MASTSSSQLQTRIQTFRNVNQDGEHQPVSELSKMSSQKQSGQIRTLLKQRRPKHLQVDKSGLRHGPASRSIYLGSYASSARVSKDVSTSRASSVRSPQVSTSHVQLEHLLQAIDGDLQTYGVEELRDGFFDASFSRPIKRYHEELMQKASLTLPKSFKHKNHPLSLRRFLPQQLQEVSSFFRDISTSRAGVKLLKSFLGVFITYILCLIPVSRNWLGRYNYIIVVSAIINHSGRSIGSQLDGALLTVLGTIAGLGWGSLALYVSTSTSTAQSGYGGVLASFLVFFTALIGWLRCVFIRFYQAVLCAGIAICYTCLANTSQNVGWAKVFDFGIPWVLGQVVCLLVSVLVFPDAGSSSLAIAFHNSFQVIQEGLVLPRKDSSSLKRRITSQIVDISQAVRDFTIDITISRFVPDDVRSIRNLVQAVERLILAIRPDTTLFDVADSSKESADTTNIPVSENYRASRLICDTLRKPTRALIDSMIQSVKCADIACLRIGGQNAPKAPGSLSASLHHLQLAKRAFDSADALLVAHPDLPALYHQSPDVAELFLFVHPVRQIANNVEYLIEKVLEMEITDTKWKIRLPSYPFYKAVLRTNPQVRHDRGGLTAGFYFRSKQRLKRTMEDLQSTAYEPAVRREIASKDQNEGSALGEYQLEQELASGKHPDVSSIKKFRFQMWEVLHRLQGFESRFAFKVALTTTLLSIPAWLSQSQAWWNHNESWWAVVTVWIMMHPRVGGTFGDLIARTLCAALGAIWGGLAYAADDGNPYVMAVFATLYMIPMLYRFTQSSHPRSGLIGCVSFTVVSLSAYTEGGKPSTVAIAWTRGLAFVIGLLAALIVNWILWPFIARHELRKSLSATMLHSAILYRGVVAKYIYYTKGEEPTMEDITKSEMLEGRLRESFVRMRQLLELTRHEMRLRAPFNPLPYSVLIAACESFFGHLVQVRQSSLYFQPSVHDSNLSTMESLTAPRRDAVAVILMNLYVLASALQTGQPVPRYLPSAAAARKKLLDRMEAVKPEQSESSKTDGKGKSIERGEGRRWADVYQYAFSGALTDIVEQLQELQIYTKEICGEVVWDSDILLEE